MEYFNYTSPDDFRNLDYNYYLLVVTPSIAEELLRKTCGNRDLNKNNLAKLEHCLNEDKYHYDVVGSGIAFDKLGRLINGHHTLTAIKETQRTITLTLCVGIDPNHLSFIDTGKSRSLADAFIMSNNAELKRVRKISQNLIRMQRGIQITNTGNVSFSNDEIIDFAIAHKDELQKIMDNERKLKKKDYYYCYQHDRLEIGVVGAIMYDYIYNKGYEEDIVNQFFYGVRSSDRQKTKIIEDTRSNFYEETRGGKKTKYSFESTEKILRENFVKYANNLEKDGIRVFRPIEIAVIENEEKSYNE